MSSRTKHRISPVLTSLALGAVLVVGTATGLAAGATRAGATPRPANITIPPGSLVQPKITPIESVISKQMVSYANEDRAARGYQQFAYSPYLSAMAQTYVDWESVDSNPTIAGTNKPTHTGDPSSTWSSAYVKAHPCPATTVCPYTGPSITPDNAASSEIGHGASAGTSGNMILAWRGSPPHWDNLMAPGWNIGGAAVDCTSSGGIAVFFAGQTTRQYVQNTITESPTPNVILPGSGTSCMSPTPDPTTGYRMVAGDGGVFDFGNAKFYGSMGGRPLNQPVVASAATPDGQGYWEVAGDGGIFSFGDAQFHGSMGGRPLNKPIVTMATDRATGGYWEVASDGGIFAFDAPFFGSMGGRPLNKAIVGMAATPDGQGYWEVASDGGIFSFGNARFYGSTGGIALVEPIVGMAATPTGGGYWMVAQDGGVFNYGAARFYGSGSGGFTGDPVVGITPAPTGGGYWIGSANGVVDHYGQAPNLGDITPFKLHLNQPMVGFASS